MRVKGGVQRLFREALYAKGFTEICTPKLIAGQSEGGADVFKTDYFGKVRITRLANDDRKFLLLRDAVRQYVINVCDNVMYENGAGGLFGTITAALQTDGSLSRFGSCV